MFNDNLNYSANFVRLLVLLIYAKQKQPGLRPIRSSTVNGYMRPKGLVPTKDLNFFYLNDTIVYRIFYNYR